MLPGIEKGDPWAAFKSDGGVPYLTEITWLRVSVVLSEKVIAALTV